MYDTAARVVRLPNGGGGSRYQDHAGFIGAPRKIDPRDLRLRNLEPVSRATRSRIANWRLEFGQWEGNWLKLILS